MVQTTLRIDEELYERIVKIANKEKRSINSQIIIIFQEYILQYNWNNNKK